ncbi:hypothetical protein VTN96DRAFT_1750 [Rasamsonia emersonii]
MRSKRTHTPASQDVGDTRTRAMRDGQEQQRGWGWRWRYLSRAELLAWKSTGRRDNSNDRPSCSSGDDQREEAGGLVYEIGEARGTMVARVLGSRGCQDAIGSTRGQSAGTHPSMRSADRFLRFLAEALSPRAITLCHLDVTVAVAANGSPHGAGLVLNRLESACSAWGAGPRRYNENPITEGAAEHVLPRSTIRCPRHDEAPGRGETLIQAYVLMSVWWVSLDGPDRKKPQDGC